jgi:hypothetical protein
LSKFGPLILGAYQPRLLVVTTPNHEFNSYFAPPPAKKGRVSTEDRYPDPTGRTNRVFRDDDHKFEWTMAEFQDWATKRKLLSKHGVIGFSNTNPSESMLY